MRFQILTPGPPLDTLIETIWDCEAPPVASRLERILPVPNAGLIINLAEDQTRVYSDDEQRRCLRRSGSVFSGLCTRSFLIDTDEQQRVMGVVFRPGGAGSFARESMQVFRDHDVDLEDLMPGPGVRLLREQLLAAGTPESRLALLERWLRLRAAGHPQHPAVLEALHVLRESPGISRIGAVVSSSGVSPRRLAQLFREQVGVTPKHYARLLRFRAVIGDVHRRRKVDWARVAADCEFYDQPHLSREFRAFSGMTPSAYLAQQGPFANHVPL